MRKDIMVLLVRAAPSLGREPPSSGDILFLAKLLILVSRVLTSILVAYFLWGDNRKDSISTASFGTVATRTILVKRVLLEEVSVDWSTFLFAKMHTNAIPKSGKMEKNTIFRDRIGMCFGKFREVFQSALHKEPTK